MKKVFILILPLLLVYSYSTAKPYEKNSKLIADFIVAWGGCSYFHPNALEGKVDMDSLFRCYYNKISKTNSQRISNKYINQFITELGTSPITEPSNIQCDNSKLLQAINSTSYSRKIKKSFTQNSGPNTHPPKNVDYSNKAGNPKFLNIETLNPFPSEEERILGLAKFWNTIYYYYPYFDQLPYSWIDELEVFIVNLGRVESSESYHMAWYYLLLQIGDVHAYMESFIIKNTIGKYHNVGQLRYLENQYVFSTFYNDSLATNQQLAKGDILIEVDGHPIEKIISEYSKVLKYFDTPAMRRKIGYRILQSKSENISLTICRNNDTIALNCQQFLPSELFSLRDKQQEASSYLWQINDSIAYVDARKIDSAHFLGFMKGNNYINHIIIDLRGASEWIKPIASEVFYPEKTSFGKWSTPAPLCPGTFENALPLDIGPENYNHNYYKGNIYLLVNEFTQSQGEFQTMFLQSAPKTQTIGSQTAGSDGNLSKLKIPGSITLNFSGAGIEYSDGYKCQYNGIKIDHLVLPTIEDIKNQFDKVLDYTINLIQ